MSEIQKGSAPFKPRARLLVLLGEQLITNEIIAIVELVKNSYDADATQVDVILENVKDIEEGKILIKDNGTGMSLDTILNVWLEPGTEYRKRQREKGERSKKFKRPLLGEKGVGRFAAHKLGTFINVITRIEDDPLETLVEVDWTRFEKDVYLDKVPVYWERRNPKVFLGKSHGTQVEIKKLRTKWTEDMALTLAQKLMALQSPFRERTGFNINLETPEFPLVSKKVRPMEEILESAIYSFKGKVDENGILTGEYRFNYPALKLDRALPIHEDIREDHKEPTCGPFEMRIYVWDLDPTTLKETVTRRTYRDFINPHTGVRLYRDGFRVWPFGELGDDWLGLDSRRVNNPTKCLSNNQIIGIVELSASKNPQLRDKTDREGLIENEQYQDFRYLVLESMNILEVERRKDKVKIDSLREKVKRIDTTIEAINYLREKMKQKKHVDLYRKNVDAIENAYMNEVVNTLEPLIVSAGIGVAYMMPAHELQMSIKALDELINLLIFDLRRAGVGGQIAERLPKMKEITDMMRDVTEGALELSRRKPETFSLISAVNSAIYVKKPELVSEKIDLNVIEKEKILFKGVKNLILTSVLNLIDNSIYWLRRNERDRKIQIIIDHDIDLYPRIIVSDNGPGIRREDLRYLGEAFFTRKPYGTGLGLYITRRAMKANDGEFAFGFYDEEPDYLTGANVILRFSPKREVK